jgi:methylenetetrahydrofolate dehydrogenase (NADP+)/methenyltetrahydrofolate cyclohydrolase
VGKPLALMLLACDAAVTVCHSRTPGLAALMRQTDILVLAAGRPRRFTAAMVTPGAVVADVGINRSADGRVVGDVDFEDARPVASRVTPVPGGRPRDHHHAAGEHPARRRARVPGGRPSAAPAPPPRG